MIETLKMEQPLTAHRASTLTGMSIEVGAPLTAICAIGQ